jgi:ABC-type sugar transport system substrate-binding protein
MGMFQKWMTGLTLCGALAMFACGDGGTTAGGGSGGGGAKKLSVYLLPKQKGLAYFETCAKGAQEAAKELGTIDLTYDGPVSGDANEAAKLVRQWAQKKADVIAVSVNDPAVLGDAMKEARSKGSHVITWDADAAPDTRELMVNQATPQQIGEALVDALAADIGAGNADSAAGEVAIISATATAANQNEWMKYMNARLAKYPKLKLVATEYCNEDSSKARQIAQDLIKAHPELKGIWGISSTAFPGAADGIQQANMSGKVQITGLSTPNDMKKFVKAGTVKSVVLWNTIDLGYLTVYVADAVATGKYKPGDATLKAGRLGEKKIVNGQVLLGDILVFTKDNIDQFDF